MRLLNTSTYELKEFVGRQIPAYAILSHTWGEDEVLFHHVVQGIREREAHKGWSKVMACCQLAANNLWTWVWIDTCCIDKSSSAEVSEAINSMFNWYRDARVCFAYLEDVLGVQSRAGFSDELRQSKWFSRGWTLQELLAPEKVIFFNSTWQDIGSKTELLPHLSTITSIKEDCLLDNTAYRRKSVAQRMSWAARRSTTREEDIAYCLLGIFDINMPLLYGEGPKAFRRLQLEIMKQSNDHSIFCWLPRDYMVRREILADTPECFYGSGSIEVMKRGEGHPCTRPVLDDYTFTNVGLKITLSVSASAMVWENGEEKIAYIALLNCATSPSRSQMTIILVGGTAGRGSTDSHELPETPVVVQRYVQPFHRTTTEFLGKVRFMVRDWNPATASRLPLLIQDSPDDRVSRMPAGPISKFLHAIRTPASLGEPIRMYGISSGQPWTHMQIDLPSTWNNGQLIIGKDAYHDIPDGATRCIVYKHECLPEKSNNLFALCVRRHEGKCMFDIALLQAAALEALNDDSKHGIITLPSYSEGCTIQLGCGCHLRSALRPCGASSLLTRSHHLQTYDVLDFVIDIDRFRSTPNETLTVDRSACVNEDRNHPWQWGNQRKHPKKAVTFQE